MIRSIKSRKTSKNEKNADIDEISDLVLTFKNNVGTVIH